MPTQQQIEAVRRHWPGWTQMQIVRHIQQREALCQMAEQQRRDRLRDVPMVTTAWGDL